MIFTRSQQLVPEAKNYCWLADKTKQQHSGHRMADFCSGPALSNNDNQHYDTSPDGQRFLMNTIHEEVASPITVILNWKVKPWSP